MDKNEIEHQAFERIKRWLLTVFPSSSPTAYRPYWGQRKDLLFEVFKDTYPHLSGDTIRSHLEESWRKDHEREWQTVSDEILAAWDEWRYAWKNYHAPTKQ